MSSAQESFQLFIVLFQLALRAAVSVALSFDGLTTIADRSGMRKRLSKLFIAS
jgi:hypothetical protein